MGKKARHEADFRRPGQGLTKVSCRRGPQTDAAGQERTFNEAAESGQQRTASAVAGLDGKNHRNIVLKNSRNLSPIARAAWASVNNEIKAAVRDLAAAEGQYDDERAAELRRKIGSLNSKLEAIPHSDEARTAALDIIDEIAAQGPLFHICDRSYEAGDVKPAGTYWAGIAAAGHSPTNDPEGEFLREAVRARHFSHLPSRMRSSFTFQSLSDATLFRDSFRRCANIYRVRLLNPAAAIHRVTWSAFNANHGAPVQLQAIEFWNGSMLYSSNIELFAESDLVFL